MAKTTTPAYSTSMPRIRSLGRRRPILSALAATTVLAVTGLAFSTATGSPTAAIAGPDLHVETVAAGLDKPWDLTFLPDSTMLYTQRDARTVTLRAPDGQQRVVLNKPAGMWSGGETGLMGIETSVDFAKNGLFFTCHGYRAGKTKDVRVVAWKLNDARTSASFSKNLVTGLPTSSGRHGGCAVQRGGGHALYIGTGDAAVGKNPQSLTSGGGKVLRVSSETGKGYSTNPYGKSSNAMKKRIWTYGHRNVQGLTRAADGRLWSVEHGSSRDDEVNALSKGGNYGWNPVPRKKGDRSYNEGSNSPMTDYKIKGAQRAASWSSGSPTIATSGGAFLYGSEWGNFEGAMAVTSLKNQSLRIFSFNPKTFKLTGEARPSQLNGTHGRLRGAQQGPDGALYLTTSNGSNDRILKVTPRPL